MRNIFLVLLSIIFLVSCNTLACYKRVDSLVTWISAEDNYNCSNPDRLKDTFYSLCWQNNKKVDEVLPTGIIGTVVCNLCLDYPISKLNNFFEEAGCKKKVVNKATRDMLINLCSSYMPFENEK